MANKPDARASGPTRRILQVHPTLLCNLLCEHCYSSSGPSVRVELDLETVCSAVSDARELGFDVLSVSGGEPFLYRGLPELLAHARSLGMQTTVTTNGTVLTPARLDGVEGLLDGMAISVDGPPDVHDELRGATGAFDRMSDGLARVRERGIPFGIIHTLTARSWPHLPWVATFAAHNGAALLQVHPLELTGRAASQLASSEAQRHAGTGVPALQGARGPLRTRAGHPARSAAPARHRRRPRARLRAARGRRASRSPARRPPRQPRARGRRDARADLIRLRSRLRPRQRPPRVAARRLERVGDDGHARFRRLCRSVFEEIAASDARLVNWHDLVVARSTAATAGAGPAHSGRSARDRLSRAGVAG